MRVTLIALAIILATGPASANCIDDVWEHGAVFFENSCGHGVHIMFRVLPDDENCGSKSRAKYPCSTFAPPYDKVLGISVSDRASRVEWAACSGDRDRVAIVEESWGNVVCR